MKNFPKNSVVLFFLTSIGAYLLYSTINYFSHIFYSHSTGIDLSHYPFMLIYCLFVPFLLPIAYISMIGGFLNGNIDSSGIPYFLMLIGITYGFFKFIWMSRKSSDSQSKRLYFILALMIYFLCAFYLAYNPPT